MRHDSYFGETSVIFYRLRDKVLHCHKLGGIFVVNLRILLLPFLFQGNLGIFVL